MSRVPGAAEALAGKVYRLCRLQSLPPSSALSACLADYRNPVPPAVMEAQALRKRARVLRYYARIGVPRDFADAMNWYRKATEATEDHAEARWWMQKAALL